MVKRGKRSEQQYPTQTRCVDHSLRRARSEALNDRRAQSIQRERDEPQAMCRNERTWSRPAHEAL